MSDVKSTRLGSAHLVCLFLTKFVDMHCGKVKPKTCGDECFMLR